MFRRDDIFCLDDLRFYHLEKIGNFGDSEIYSNGDYTVLLDRLTHEQELYLVGFGYKNDEVKDECK